MRDKKRDEMKQRREEAKEKALEEKRIKVSIVYLSFEWHKDFLPIHFTINLKFLIIDLSRVLQA